MSAYIVEDKTVNRIITGLLADYDRHYDWNKAEILKAAQIASTDEDWTTKLGNAMAAMNDAAINYRYGDGTAVHDRVAPYEWHTTVPDGLIQLHKSLGCFLYQCCEGQVPETPLYKALENWKHSVADRFISTSPAYEHAVWA